jgi:hypothetical protein
VWLAAILAVFGAYVVYNHTVDTPDIQIQQGEEGTSNIEVPEFDAESAQIGEAAVGTVEVAEYTVLDENKNVKRVFGFDKLLNPDENDEAWKLQKPYMNIYEQDAVYEIESDRGTVEVETIGGKPSPTDAHLIDNVKIHIRPTSNEGPTEATIRLEELVYNSERSEYTTDGPLKIVSEDGQMEGEGMVLIYNERLSRVEYLKIIDLDYLHLKNVSALSGPQAPPKRSVDSSSVEVANADRPEASGPADMEKVSVDDTAVGTAGRSESEEDDYYECRFYDNVVIKYGRQIVVEGADEVTISNIFLSRRSGQKDVGRGASADSEEVAAEAVVSGGDNLESDSAGSVAAGSGRGASDEEAVEVFVTCKGGIVIRPTISVLTSEVASRSARRRMIELSGKPVCIKETGGDGDEGAATMVQCGMLKYDLDSDVMNMFTNEEEYISVNMADSEMRLQTTGSVKWERKKSSAVVTGPGKLLMLSNKDSSSSNDEGTEMRFEGVMELFFAEHRPDDSLGGLTLKSANLAGGMAATTQQRNGSQVSADSVAFLFDEAGDIRRMDLAGNVDFSSVNGRLTSQRAKILFAKDTSGGAYAKTVENTGEPALIPANTRGGMPPARFEATKIDYDVTTGNALATGPVKFTFYAKDANDTDAEAEPVPIMITAEENAEFFAAENRVVFNRNVVGMQLKQTGEYIHEDTLSGGKLIVDLESGQAGGADIRHVTVAGGTVRLESKRFMDERIVNHVRLSCRQIDHDAGDEVVIATGPGEIQINNENVPPPEKKDEDKRIALERPCFALIKDFDELRWFTKTNRITAEGKTKSVTIGYLPIIDGQWGRVVRAVATHIEADFTETGQGRSELAGLKATGGVFYEEVGENEFAGDSLLYDAGKSLMTVSGSAEVPCLLNGSLVDGVEYDLETGKVKARLASRPGTLRAPGKRKGK